MPKNEKKEDKILEEIKRHNKVLMEHMEQQVKTVAEQHTSTREEIKQLKNSMESRFNTVEMAVMENSRGLKRVEQRVGGVEQRLGNVEQKLDTTLANHEQRIKKVEEKVGA